MTDHDFNRFVENYIIERTIFMERVMSDLKKELKYLMDKMPEDIHDIGFHAYTMYFNDGEECNFHVHADEIEQLMINGSDEHLWDVDSDSKEYFFSDKIYPNGYSAGSIPNPNYDAEKTKAFTDLLDFINNIPEEIWKDFGDHSTFRIYRDGSVKLFDYSDHD